MESIPLQPIQPEVRCAICLDTQDVLPSAAQIDQLQDFNLRMLADGVVARCCNKTFHANCLSQHITTRKRLWPRQSVDCPLCKQDLENAALAVNSVVHKIFLIDFFSDHQLNHLGYTRDQLIEMSPILTLRKEQLAG